MSAPINLNKVRKARARADEKARADANVAKHGRSKTARLQDKTKATAQTRHLDGHKMVPPHSDKG